MAESGEKSRMENLRKQVAKTRALKNQGVTFKVEERAPGYKTVAAYQGPKKVGRLDLLDPKDIRGMKGAREILAVEVDPKFQRQGVASSLYNEARKAGLKPVHSAKLTPQGFAFAQSVGGARVPVQADREEFKNKKELNKKVGKARAMQEAVKRQMLQYNQAQTKAPMQYPPGYDPFSGESLEEFTRRTNPGMGANIGRTANMGLGALNVIGFLPMLNQAGNIMAGRTVGPLPRNPYVGAMN